MHQNPLQHPGPKWAETSVTSAMPRADDCCCDAMGACEECYWESIKWCISLLSPLLQVGIDSINRSILSCRALKLHFDCESLCWVDAETWSWSWQETPSGRLVITDHGWIWGGWRVASSTSTEVRVAASARQGEVWNMEWRWFTTPRWQWFAVDDT
jgi:hypothetical protein